MVQVSCRQQQQHCRESLIYVEVTGGKPVFSLSIVILFDYYYLCIASVFVNITSAMIS